MRQLSVRDMDGAVASDGVDAAAVGVKLLEFCLPTRPGRPARNAERKNGIENRKTNLKKVGDGTPRSPFPLAARAFYLGDCTTLGLIAAWPCIFGAWMPGLAWVNRRAAGLAAVRSVIRVRPPALSEISISFPILWGLPGCVWEVASVGTLAAFSAAV